MHQKTHDQIAAELRLQLKTVAACLAVEQLSPFDSATLLRESQRLAIRTFASQLWLCMNEDEVSQKVRENRPGAEAFYPVAAFAVEFFIKERDLTKVPFSGWGQYSLLSDAVTIYLKGNAGSAGNSSRA